MFLGWIRAHLQLPLPTESHASMTAHAALYRSLECAEACPRDIERAVQPGSLRQR